MNKPVHEKVRKTKITIKEPTQERSRQTVTAIIDACTQLLMTEGFYEITTDIIAKAAGVSIGSFYQFFGNKESVVQALIKNIYENDKSVLNENVAQILTLPQKDRVKSLVDVMISIARRNSPLRAKLTTIVYYVLEPSYISELSLHYQQTIKQCLVHLPDRDIDKVSYLFANAFTGLINNMAIENPEAIHDPLIAGEIMHLFTKYLDPHGT